MKKEPNYNKIDNQNDSKYNKNCNIENSKCQQNSNKKIKYISKCCKITEN